MKKYILLFCLLFLLSGCGVELIVYGVIYTIETVKENNAIGDLNSECLRLEGVECMALETDTDENSIYSVKGVTAGKGSLFILDRNLLIRVDLKNKKAVILAEMNDWKIFHDSIDGYGQKDEYETLKGIGLVGDTLYIGATIPMSAQKLLLSTTDTTSYFEKIGNPYLRRLNIGGGSVTTDKKIAPDKIPPSFQSMISDGSFLYFIDNTQKRIVKIDVFSGKLASIPVFDREEPVYIPSLVVSGNSLYFIVCEPEVCQFTHLDMKSGQTSLIFEKMIDSKDCLKFNKYTHITKDTQNIYFNDTCSNILRFNIKTEKIDTLSHKLTHGKSLIQGMSVCEKYLCIVERFPFVNKLLIRRVDLKSGQTSYLAGVLEN